MATAKTILDTLRGVLVMNAKVEELSAQVRRLQHDLTQAREDIAELRGYVHGAVAARGRQRPRLGKD